MFHFLIHLIYESVVVLIDFFDFLPLFLYFWPDLLKIKQFKQKYHLVFDDFAKKIQP
jgi:hypothetical protein